MKKTIVIIGVFLAVVVLMMLFIGLSRFTFTKKTFTAQNYSNIMKENIKGNPKVVDIAMLGAHDAFSDKITGKSMIDPQVDKNSIMNHPIAQRIFGGMFARLAKAQKSGGYDLAQRGVRYFDVRITNSQNTWYTTHGLVSAPLEGYLIDVIRFLQENPGEFIVFDMQHIWTGDATIEELFAFIQKVEVEGKNLFDYVNHNPFTQPLKELRYFDVAKEKGGVIPLAKTPEYEGCFHYEYDAAIRSTWHHQNDTAILLKKIREEVEGLKQNPSVDREKFRVNQAQKTGTISTQMAMKTILGWSLLDMAENFNAIAIKQEDFDQWFEVMPIYMVDYADSVKENFNDVVIDKINRYNGKK